MKRARKLDLLAAAGVSIWLDDLGRTRLDDGSLADMVEFWNVRGVTTNPTIFAKAVAGSDAYDAQLSELASAGADVDEAVRALTTTDVRAACDVLAGVYAESGGTDGLVSIEVDPRLARDTTATVEEAVALAAAVDRPNVMIKIPATAEGLPAIREVLGRGISVNATLIVGLARGAEVVEAFLGGIEDARANGHDLARIASTASYFVSRVDTDVDPRLDALGTPEAAALRGKIALANARLAFLQHSEAFESDRWKALAEAGANPQRVLWASTGVKDSAFLPAKYVTGLISEGTINSMPQETLESTITYHGGITDTIRLYGRKSRELLDAAAGLGIDYDELVTRLEAEGVDKFVASWEDLLKTVGAKLAG